MVREPHHPEGNRRAEFAEGLFKVIASFDILRALRGSTGSPRPEPVEGRASALKVVADQPEPDPRLATRKPENPKKEIDGVL
jgi:hypothetical protein